MNGGFPDGEDTGGEDTGGGDGPGAGASLTIGAFARAARLSPKALRLYDELDLLRPARVDPRSGYRFYSPHQLERARLVAWLRRLGMPLARIREVTALAPPRAAEAVRRYWAEVEAETSARRDLAEFLVDQLSAPLRPKEPVMTLELRCAALSDGGLVRPGNQDAVHAGTRLLAVADGFGPGGAPASAAAVEALKALDGGTLDPGDVLNALEDAVARAARAVREVAVRTAGAAGRAEVGTTLTALLWTASRLALVHIGDSRAHVLRDGELFLVTEDHTVTGSLVEEGRLTEEEARSHPGRSLLLRALTGSGGHGVPDIRLHDTRPGDRYLLCSDGLSAVVPGERLRSVLVAAPDPAAAVRELRARAYAAGAPDHLSCVVAEVAELAPGG
ncbi:MerR family transcriptional regulator [Streptomyces sp. SID4919]|uniref:MerR family transcriptional regulator n=1 Tax=unclassified Streptomyces TaxID=2593676 RepID=UPI0008238FF4|nr:MULTISPECIES: MerR family transcriptional regulator [unclassified Streptomyces]MYY13620.1 MerR family transcriptional regulator [Streptomyces sp. SID4919]SCK33598.1 Serine/threonine protein phosphatase PrpC [Streptomyces sp. AmelKG-E11A]